MYSSFRRKGLKAASSALVLVVLPGIVSAQSDPVGILFSDLATWVRQTSTCTRHYVSVKGASVYGQGVKSGDETNYISGEFTSVNKNVLTGYAHVYQVQDTQNPPLFEASPEYPMTLTLQDANSAFLQISDAFGSGVADSALLQPSYAFGGAMVLLSGTGWSGTMSVAFYKGFQQVCVH